MTPDPATVAVSLDEARAIADQAIALLLRHGLLPLPRNYAVAFEYVSGSNAALQKALDDHLQSGKPIDDFLLRDLHDEYITADQFRYLHGMGSDLRNILHGLIQTLSEAGDGAQTFGQSLAQHLARLDTSAGAEALRQVAADLLSTTRAAQQQNRQLQHSLEATRKEAENLRVELEQYRRDALIDPLTGLFNRRAMDIHVEELMLATESGRTFSVVMMDIDHFKRINDTYGHALGDMVLRNVADTIRKCIRGQDVAVRYGGEEFLILLPDTPLDGARTVAETLRARVEALRLVRRRDNFLLAPFTASLGVSSYRAGDTRDSLLQRADQALYLSKRVGRNRVSLEFVQDGG